MEHKQYQPKLHIRKNIRLEQQQDHHKKMTELSHDTLQVLMQKYHLYNLRKEASE